jgi:hypothetical protein
MKFPGFDADQMLLVLVVCLIAVGLALWRLFTLY